MDFERGSAPDSDASTLPGLAEVMADAREAMAAAVRARASIPVGREVIRMTPGPTGVVMLPAGTSLDSIRVEGRDLIVMLPDGGMMVIVDGAVFVPQLVIGEVQIPPLNLAALLIGNEPQPAAGPPQSSAAISPIRWARSAIPSILAICCRRPSLPLGKVSGRNSFRP